MSNPNPSPALASLSNKTEIFQCADHANNISKKLQTFYEKKEFFDVVLIAGVDNVEVQAHRIVLSASSDYFLGMFRSILQKSKPDEVELKGIDGTTMKLIVHFMYTGSIEICCETVETILIAADFLQMNTLIAICCDFMGEQLNASNCLGITLFAEQHHFSGLLKRASSYAYAHFDKVWTQEEFLQLNEEQLNNLLSSDDFVPSSEEIVFQGLVAWVEYDKENREKLIFNLLSHVRFTLLSPKFIIDNRHSVCKTIECYELICSWLQWHLSPESRSQFPLEFTKPRKSNQILAFVSGEYTNDMKIQTFNPELNSWSYQDLPRPSKNRSGYSTIVINKKLIIVGGEIGGIETNSVECFDLQTKEWSDLPPMGLGRCYPGLAELNSDLYVVGGRVGGNWLCAVEKYNFSTQKWQNVASMRTECEWVQVAFHEGFLYAVGDKRFTMECYNPTANNWTLKPFNKEDCVSFGFAVVSGHLYVVGGYRNGTIKMVERYHPSTDTWTVASSLKVGRHLIRCTAFNNRLIAYGGYNESNFVNLVEEYNPETNEWSTFSPLLSHRLGYCCNNILTI